MGGGGGGAQSFHPLKIGGGGWGGDMFNRVLRMGGGGHNKFWIRDFPIFLAPPPPGPHF